jgi:osmoprotectant transport system permease protein
VTTIGLVTVTAIITEGGLGQLILDALQRRLDFTRAFTGASLSLLLAIGADVLLIGVQRFLTPWARGRVLAR